jgi:hypothetical protein
MLHVNATRAAKHYLACRESLHADEHARKLLEIKGSAAVHASYCIVTAVKGCVWCLDGLRRRSQSIAVPGIISPLLTPEELAIVKSYSTDIENSRDAKGKSRALVRRKAGEAGGESAASKAGEPPRKKHKSNSSSN